jgi:hypothetical protein
MYFDILLAMLTIWAIYGALYSLGQFSEFVEPENGGDVHWFHYILVALVGAAIWPVLKK